MARQGLVHQVFDTARLSRISTDQNLGKGFDAGSYAGAMRRHVGVSPGRAFTPSCDVIIGIDPDERGIEHFEFESTA